MNRITLLILGVALSLMLFGCGGTSNPVTTPTTDSGIRTADWHYEYYNVFELRVANPYTVEGYVTVAVVGSTLYVDYDITDSDFYFSETHIALATDFSGFPQNKQGIPQPGQFPYFEYYDLEDYAQTAHYEIDLTGEDWWPATQFCFLIHANVHEVECDEYGCWETNQNTGWAGEQEWEVKNKWGWYDCLDLECVIDLPDPPSGTFTANQPGGTYYWRFMFSNVGEGDVENGVYYYGYCVQFVSLYPGQTYQAWMYDTLHDDLPGMYSDVNWGAINWILNNKNYCGDNPTYGTIQAAIWWIVYDNWPSQTNWAGQGSVNLTWAKCLMDAALENDDFVPAEGELQAVLLYGGNGGGYNNPFQSNIFEMEIDCVD